MSKDETSRNGRKLFTSLHERAKELTCLYKVEEILSDFDQPLEDVFRRIIASIPPGWQFADSCQARVVFGSERYESPEFKETPQVHTVDIRVQDMTVGQISVSYREPTPECECGPFLEGEIKLIQTIADRLSHFILHKRLRHMYAEMSEVRRQVAEGKAEWRIALDLLRNTDQKLLIRVSRKMMNYLGWRGVPEARALLQRYGEDRMSGGAFGAANVPQQKESLDRYLKLSEETFAIASANLADDEILSRIQKWINEERSSSAVKTLENVYASLGNVLESMRRYRQLMPEDFKLPEATANSVRVALIRRFFTEQLEFINIAKKYLDLEDFFDLTERIIFPPGSHGKLGGKSAGLFLAKRVLKKAGRRLKAIGEVKKPKTWYIASDALIAFVQHNNLEEVTEQKYKDIEEIRQEYPHLVQVFKNCTFPNEIVKGLSLALDDFGDVPLIVRSSSLLEDRFGTAFAGKYKSLFLANQGDREERLTALLDAIAEVYASIFSPDPIEYRAERGLLDFYEEMGIMIQAVIGKRVGRYFFPAYAGVAFSRNEFRWSPRIRREDGLLRIVPGLGTRAVDRVSDDYPILAAPGRPHLRVNVSTDEVVRYSPKKMDVIDLEKNSFETVDVKSLMREIGQDYPASTKVISIFRDGLIQQPMGIATDLEKEDFVVTFEGLLSRTPFVRQLEAIIKTLESALGFPVDIEFASDGTDFYLLQCRPQSSSPEDVAVEIPARLPEGSVLFTAKRYVSNGRVPDITHIVYVDPDRYSEIREPENLAAVGKAVGKLNKILPRRRFILMGPGRWGSRGDIRLGVRVTYADISNAAMLIEIARKKGNYVPDVSFGTHFFQDLVESGIRYLPLYPDDNGVIYDEEFFRASPNVLSEMLPEHAALAHVLRVIDVPQAAAGRILQILMNADLELAVATFAASGAAARTPSESAIQCYRDGEDHSCWRLRMAEQIAFHAGMSPWGIKAVYLYGSTLSGTANPDSDIDLLIHFTGRTENKKEVEAWLKGWSLSLAETNYARTGFHSEGLLDVRIVTDQDIDRAGGVGATVQRPEDSLRELPLGKPEQKKSE